MKWSDCIDPKIHTQSYRQTFFATTVSEISAGFKIGLHRARAPRVEILTGLGRHLTRYNTMVYWRKRIMYIRSAVCKH
jgi:hypothetical protein